MVRRVAASAWVGCGDGHEAGHGKDVEHSGLPKVYSRPTEKGVRLLMALIDITAVVWLLLAGYAFSVLRSWERTSRHVRDEFDKMISENSDT